MSKETAISLKRYKQDETKVTRIRKSHTPFRLITKSVTWVTLNGETSLLQKKNNGAHQRTLNEARSILSVAKCRPVI